MGGETEGWVRDRGSGWRDRGVGGETEGVGGETEGVGGETEGVAGERREREKDEKEGGRRGVGVGL